MSPEKRPDRSVLTEVQKAMIEEANRTLYRLCTPPGLNHVQTLTFPWAQAEVYLRPRTDAGAKTTDEHFGSQIIVINPDNTATGYELLPNYGGIDKYAMERISQQDSFGNVKKDEEIVTDQVIAEVEAILEAAANHPFQDDQRPRGRKVRGLGGFVANAKLAFDHPNHDR